MLRDWTVKDRISWWVKFAGMVAATFVGIAGAFRLMGFRPDFQSQTEATRQHQEMRAEIRADVDGKIAKNEPEHKEILQQLGKSTEATNQTVQNIYQILIGAQRAPSGPTFSRGQRVK